MEDEAPRGRGAEGAEGVGCGEGVYPSPPGERSGGWAPSPEKFLSLVR